VPAELGEDDGQLRRGLIHLRAAARGQLAEAGGEELGLGGVVGGRGAWSCLAGGAYLHCSRLG
jgi:hypothetical protein